MPSVAVITGASSGIGLATTRALAAAGWSSSPRLAGQKPRTHCGSWLTR
jgi:NAD(P)-dependent dehydrogenase (short-subunit alcohol dehydrogenase family)